jgi:hypothetical protein
VRKIGRLASLRAALVVTALTVTAGLTVQAAPAQAAQVSVTNGTQFTDTSGNGVHAHGGGVIKVDDYYYWFGENRNPDDTFKAVSVYRSRDLRTWEFRKDGTATYNVSTEMQLSLVFEEENINVAVLTPLSFTAEGRWELWTDTLVIQLDSATTQLLSYDFNLGTLPKSFIESKKDSIDIMVEQHKQGLFQFIKQTVSRAEGHKTSVSKTGNMMFWEDQHTLPWGEVQSDKLQFTKKD